MGGGPEQLTPIFTFENERLRAAGKLTGDNLKLYLDVERLGEAPITAEEILELLSPHIRRDRVDLGVIADIARSLDEVPVVRRRRIAKGRPPEAGRTGKLVLLVKTLRQGGGAVSVDGRGFADYSNMHLFDNIVNGQVIGRLYVGAPGSPGEDVFGNAIPAAVGQDVEISFDSTIRIEPAPEPGRRFRVLIAGADGLLAENAGTLGIREELRVRGDLDYRFGNIDFVGTVTIGGDVNAGFQVIAKKGIRIEGAVRRATVRCHEGDVVVAGRIGGEVTAAGEVECAGIENGDVAAGGAIRVKREIRDSKIRTHATVFCTEGRIVGGDLFAVCGLEAKEIGNPAGVRTGITLCSDVETTPEFEQLTTKIRSHEQAIELLKLHLGPLAKQPQRVVRLKADFRKKIERLLARLDAVERSRIVLLTKKQLLLEGAQRSETARVNVMGVLYPGVEIRAGEQRFSVPEPLPGPCSIRYSISENAFTVEPIGPIECRFEGDRKEEETTA